jgi:mono/diheme cytochrome c family protein
VLAANPYSVVSVVLDEQVADVITFVRNNWGNDASQVDARTVASLRPPALRQAWK